MVEKLFTPEEAAEYLSISILTVKKWLRSGKLNGVKISNMWRVRESDLEELIRSDSQCADTVKEP
ncbi:helix-turn-helix domain-containing protein [Desulfotomaculum copahuensis]|uniref:Helix-turn-helix domain-containing protein n=1 Tax=Desulfotomaculum copahuensis TaxID=1838280 RepID=A0A1B7LAF9_9FIRM|nr:helix-turn-helix domain-containing protein [Desulfotomaculum copahuensis]OAT79307.1 hypothetical protein A6M21_16225 [Desulfotomaculum copahuensis]